MIQKIKVAMPSNGRKIRKEIALDYDQGRIFISFGFNRPFMAEVKAMDGAKWHGYDEDKPRKVWSVKDNSRNRFQIRLWQWEALDGDDKLANPNLNPYHRYDLPLPLDVKTRRPLRDHQKFGKAFVITRRYCEAAFEMGTGKTLIWIEAIESMLNAHRIVKDDFDTPDSDLVWYIGPKAGVKAVERELKKWQALFTPRMMTYEGLVKVMREWKDESPGPVFVCFDEGQKIKNPTAKRSQCAFQLAESVRAEWGDLGSVVILSGTPSPKSPIDWYHQLDCIQPGFLREGNIHKFKARLCLIEHREGVNPGVTFPHILTWLDDDRKCNLCGEFEEHSNHNKLITISLPSASCEGYNKFDHKFVKSKNEIDLLYKRMKGIVEVKYKKDCTDLPEKIYEIINLKPTVELLRACKLIKARCPRTIQALTLLRELSDGFQYTDVEIGRETCEHCHGEKQTMVKMPKDGIDPMAPYRDSEWVESLATCDRCGGTGETVVFERSTIDVKSPKDEIFIDELDEHEDVGRYTVWAGFQGSIDRLVGMAHTQGWATLRLDGRGLKGEDEHGNHVDPNTLLDGMDLSNPRYKEYRETIPRIVTVGNPDSGGMAYTFTSSPTGLFYSNAFKGDARWQAEDRGHRLGMDVNRGYTIKDLILLPSDKLVYDNLKLKRRLQDISLGELHRIMETEQEMERTI